MRNWIRWIVFILVIVASYASLLYVQQRYTSLLQGGVEYQWPVTIEKSTRWAPSDYVEVHFLGESMPWRGKQPPSVGQEVYVTFTVKKTGIILPKEALADKPVSGLYLVAPVQSFSQGQVTVDVPCNRAYVNPSKVKPQFMDKYRGIILATMKFKDGRGVITGLYSRGVPIESAVPASQAEQDKDAQIPLNRIGDPPVTVHAGAEKKDPSGLPSTKENNTNVAGNENIVYNKGN